MKGIPTYKILNGFGLLLLAWMAPAAGYAQNSESNPYFAPQVNTQAPNAAAITKYGDYQVNGFSGVPDISIPLYEINSGPFKIPITLSYHASGFKVTDAASWVGLGWTVTGCGQITRNVQGFGDEEEVGGYLNGKLKHREDFDNTKDSSIQYLMNVKTQYIDTRPDIFSYSFLDKSGKFFFNGLDSMKPVFMPYTPLKLVANRNRSSLNFDVTDENGNVFSFGKTAVDNIITTLRNINNVTATCWWINSMISQDRHDTVLYQYATPNSFSIEDYTDLFVLDDDVSIPNSGYTANVGNSYSLNATAYGSEYSPAEIRYKNGKVVFEPSVANRQEAYTNGKSLSALKVYTVDGNTGQYILLKSVNFFQSYFAPSDLQAKRLRLDSIAICDNGGVTIQTYRFDYNNDVTLPRTSDNRRDYWGYFNGQNKPSRIPKMTVDYRRALAYDSIQIGNGGMDPDSTKMQACMLRRIYYPTGGHTDFEFETNQYQENGVVKLAGGLRIHAIKSYDSISTSPVVKTYEYVQSRPNFTLNNYFFFTTQTYRLFRSEVGGCLGVQTQKRVRTFTSSPSVNIEPFDAVPVAYTDVIEYTGTSDHNIGKREMIFTDAVDQVSMDTYTGTPPIMSFFYKRGKLWDDIYYKVDSHGNYIKVRHISNAYSNYGDTTYNMVGLTVGKPIINEETSPGGFQSDVMYLAAQYNPNCSQYSDAGSYSYADFGIKAGDSYLTYSADTTFDQQDPTKYIVQKTSYGRTNIRHQQITDVFTTDSKGITHDVHRVYPEDLLVGSASTTGNPVLDSMISRHYQSAVVEESEQLTGVPGMTNAVTDASLLTYKPGSLGAIVLDTRSKLQIVKPIADFTPAYVAGGQLVKDSRYSKLVSMNSYDGMNNILQFTTRNAFPESIIWDYNASLPIAVVKGAIQQDIAYTSFETDSKGNWSFGGQPVTNTTAPTGNRVYPLTAGDVIANGLDSTKQYIISYWSNVQASSLVNGTVGVSGFTKNGWTYYQHTLYPAAGKVTLSGTATIDELRLYPVTALMTTYTHRPGLGLMNMTGPDNMITYYEYDSFGRLWTIRNNDRHIVKLYEYGFKKF